MPADYEKLANQEKKFSKKRSELIKRFALDLPFLGVIVLLCVIGTIENVRIIGQDQTYFYYDIADTYRISTSLYGKISEGNMARFADEYVNHFTKDYPVLIVVQPFIFYFFLGVNEDAAALSNCIHIFIILISAYFIGKRVGGRYTGLLSAAVLFFIPSFLPFSRVYLPDFAQMSMFTLCLAIFIYSDFFSSTLHSAAFGLFFGLGMLAKYSFFIYMVPVLLLTLARKMIENPKRIHDDRKRIRNILLSIFIGILIMCVWYLKNTSQVVYLQKGQLEFDDRLEFNRIGLLEKAVTVANGYLNIFFKSRFMLVYSIIYAICFLYVTLNIGSSLLRKNHVPEYIELLMCPPFMMLPFIFHSAVPRYLLPILPVVSLTISIAVLKFANWVNQELTHEQSKIWEAAFIIILIMSMFVYKGYAENNIASNNHLFIDGLVAASNFTSPVGDLISTVNNITNGKKVTSILFLQDSLAMSILSNNIERSIKVIEPIPWISRPHLCVLNTVCNVSSVSSRDGLCNVDIMILSSSPLPGMLQDQMEKNMPDRVKNFENSINISVGCLGGFTLIRTFQKMPIEYFEYSDIEVYVNNRLK